MNKRPVLKTLTPSGGEKQPTRHHRAVRKTQGGTPLAAGVLFQLREGRGQKVGSPKPSLSRSPTPSLLPTPEGTFQALLLSPLVSVLVITHCPPPRTPLPPPGVPPPSLVLFLTTFAPPFLRPCGCSFSLGCLNTSSSHRCLAPWTTARVSLPGSQCKVPRSELWLSPPCLKVPPLVPPFIQLVKPQT